MVVPYKKFAHEMVAIKSTDRVFLENYESGRSWGTAATCNKKDIKILKNVVSVIGEEDFSKSVLPLLNGITKQFI